MKPASLAIGALLLLAIEGVHATPPPFHPSSGSQAEASASSKALSASDSSASVTGSTFGGSQFDSRMYVLPGPVSAAPLPPGLCVRGKSRSYGVLFNLFSYAASDTETDEHCLERVLHSQVEIAGINRPVAPVINYIYQTPRPKKVVKATPLPKCETKAKSSVLCVPKEKGK